MDTAALDAKTTEFDVEDVEYLRHGDKPLLAKVYRPRGDGPFPALVDCTAAPGALATASPRRSATRPWPAHGIVSISLDFRSGERRRLSGLAQRHQLRDPLGQAATPRTLKTRPDLVGISGQSSGGHLAMLAAMRPHDPRYAAIPLPAGSPAHDATVRCVVMSWPVINPLSRYRYAKRARPPPIRRTGRRHHRAPGPSGTPRPTWPRATRCSSSSAARRCAAAGDLVAGPRRHPARLQGRGVELPGNEPQRFVANYRKAGGDIELDYFEATATPATRRTCRRPATCSPTWWRSSGRHVQGLTGRTYCAD